GPSLDPRDKRLAVEVEDHPLDYGDFEGTIPPGEYGGGTVQLWDRGYWEPEGTLPVDRALAGGQLKFTLHGKRLKGSWVLVRMRDDPKSKRANWLLIKHRDQYARDQREAAALLAEDRSIASGRTMAQIAAGKGRGPTAFMLKGAKKSAADAVWNSNQPAGRAAVPARSRPPKDAGKPSRTRRAAKASANRTAALRMSDTRSARTSALGSASMPQFVPPQLCQSVARP